LSSKTYDHNIYVSEIVLYHIVTHGAGNNLHCSSADISSEYLRSFDDIFTDEKYDKDTADDDEEFRYSG